jgi:hypothetical protein
MIIFRVVTPYESTNPHGVTTQIIIIIIIIDNIKLLFPY